MDDTKLFIEVMPDTSISDRGTYTTGLSSTVGQMIEFNAELCEKIGRKMEEFSQVFSDKILADETELEFSFGITGSGNICILSGSSSIGVKVTLKWKKKENISN